jgi:hypothetical protein
MICASVSTQPFEDALRRSSCHVTPSERQARSFVVYFECATVATPGALGISKPSDPIRRRGGMLQVYQ